MEKNCMHLATVSKLGNKQVAIYTYVYIYMPFKSLIIEGMGGTVVTIMTTL